MINIFKHIKSLFNSEQNIEQSTITEFNTAIIEILKDNVSETPEEYICVYPVDNINIHSKMFDIYWLDDLKVKSEDNYLKEESECKIIVVYKNELFYSYINTQHLTHDGF